MSNNSSIPFWVAVLININIVVGSAFFLGAPQFCRLNGYLAPFVWIFCGTLLLPLVIVLSKLSRMYPTAGGLYIYSLKHLGSFWGFVSGWGYYVGAAAGNAVVLHGFSQQLQLFGFVSKLGISSVAWDLILVTFFTFLTLLNIKFLERIQIGLTIVKAVPMILVLAVLPILFNVNNLITATPSIGGMIQTIPLALFAYIGVEACCAITDKISDGQKNASRVILISFALIVLIYSVLQFTILCVSGAGSANPFFAVIPQLTNNQTLISWGNNVINLSIMASLIGGFYAMFYYNNWNLYAMGNENSMLFSNKITKINKAGSPWVCVFVQSVIVIIFLLVTTNINYLMTMSDIGTVVTYMMSALSFIVIFKKLWGYLAIVSCALLVAINSQQLINAGLIYVAPFLVVLLLGIVAHKLNRVMDGN
jgi:APA family basic amino acid/polyamine antiporter